MALVVHAEVFKMNLWIAGLGRWVSIGFFSSISLKFFFYLKLFRVQNAEPLDAAEKRSHRYYTMQPALPQQGGNNYKNLEPEGR